MELSRRSFFKAAGAAFATSMAFEFMQPSPALAVESSPSGSSLTPKSTRTSAATVQVVVAPFARCVMVSLSTWKAIPIIPSIRVVCAPKGATMFQLRNVVNPETHEVEKSKVRQTKPLVRRPFSKKWEPITWEQAIREIARKTKETRDAGFVETEEGKGKTLTVNRCESIASLGGSQQNSEEEYLILKMMRALGIVAIDNQARV